MRSRRVFNFPPALAAALIVLAGFLAYANSFHGALILDDSVSITLNPSIRQLWPWTSPPVGGPTGGRPVANFTFMLNYAMSGTEVWSYHVTNLVVHLLAGLALFGVVRRTLLRPPLRAQFGDFAAPLAAAAALLWVVHPVQTAAVDYISQRTELLMGLFYLLTLYCFIRSTEGRPRLWQPLALAACTLGMASKEVMATAPVLVALYDRTFVAGSFRAVWRERGRFHLALAATWVLLAWLMATSNLTDRGAGFGINVSPLDYAFTEMRIVPRYLGLTLWPHPLVFDYGWAFAHSIAEVWASAVVLGGIVAAVLWALIRRPMAGFLGAWFLVILLPTSSFVPVSEQPMAESRLYLPLAAIMVALVVGMFAWTRQRSWPTLIALAAVGIGLTLHRNRDYRDGLSIWSDTIAKMPRNPRAHRTLADHLLQEGRSTEAIASYQTAIQLKPDYTEAHYNLGNAYLSRRDFTTALVHLENALRLKPTHAKAHVSLGNALLDLQRPREAIVHYEAALRVIPNFFEARKNLSAAQNRLGASELEAGRIAEAQAAFRTAAQLDPESSDAWHNLSLTLMQQNQIPEAIAAAEISIKTGPNSPTNFIHYGNLLFQANRIADAAASYENALRLDAGNAEAHNNLGVILLRAQRRAEAREHFLAALRLKPDYADARDNLTLTNPAQP